MHLHTKAHEDLRHRLESANGNLDQICEDLSDVPRSLDPIASVFTSTPSTSLRHQAKKTALIIEIPKPLTVNLGKKLEFEGKDEIDVVAELRKSASTCLLFTLRI